MSWRCDVMLLIQAVTVKGVSIAEDRLVIAQLKPAYVHDPATVVVPELFTSAE